MFSGVRSKSDLKSFLAYATPSKLTSARVSQATLTDPKDEPQNLRLRRTTSIERVSIVSRRIHGWSWQAFPIGMGTGAVYLTLSDLKVPNNHGLNVITEIFWYLCIAFFLLNIATLLLQLIFYPWQAKRLVTNSKTGIYVPLMVLSFASIIVGCINIGVPTGRCTIEFIAALFWIYVGMSIAICMPLLMIWYNQKHDVLTMTPAWAFPIFPMMLVGIIAENCLHVIPAASVSALRIFIAAYIFQGLGFFMTFFYICIYVQRIITTGFMEGHQANGAFVACGPPGFTALALLSLGEEAQTILKSHGMISENAGEIWYVCSIPPAMMLFGLAFFFFVFGILPWWFKLHKKLGEILGCWSLTFPNVGWILTLRKLGDTFQCDFFYIWNLVMTIMMCVIWTVLIVLTIAAFWQGKIFISPREDIVKDSILHAKLRRHVEDLELGESRFTSQTVTPQARSPRCRSPSGSRDGSGSGSTMDRLDSHNKMFSFAGSDLGTPPLSGTSTPAPRDGPAVTFC